MMVLHRKVDRRAKVPPSTECRCRPRPPVPSGSLTCRPWHSRKFGQFTDEWFKACNDAFVAAMLANPTERP